MTDEEAERAMWERYHRDTRVCPGSERTGFNAGFRAGLAHARKQGEQRIAALERVAAAAEKIHLAYDGGSLAYVHGGAELNDALRVLDALRVATASV